MMKVENFKGLTEVENGVETRYEVFEIGGYYIDYRKSTNPEWKHDIERCYARSATEYLPEIHLNNGVFGNEEGHFEIQTIAYGAKEPAEILKVIAGYQQAVKVAEFLTERYLKEA